MISYYHESIGIKLQLLVLRQNTVMLLLLKVSIMRIESTVEIFLSQLVFWELSLLSVKADWQCIPSSNSIYCSCQEQCRSGNPEMQSASFSWCYLLNTWATCEAKPCLRDTWRNSSSCSIFWPESETCFFLLQLIGQNQPYAPIEKQVGYKIWETSWTSEKLYNIISNVILNSINELQ